jgi:hypothetical protein
MQLMDKKTRASLKAGFVSLLFCRLATTAIAQEPGTFTATGEMTAARTGHTATLLDNGKVLIAGGSGAISAELYDPDTGTFTPTGDLTTPRWETEATSDSS